MSFESVAHVYREQMRLQQRDGDDEFVFWRPAWIPVCSLYSEDWSSGLYLDAETGVMGSWNRFGERKLAFESSTGYLEEMADSLEAPGLVMGYKPGLVNGSLIWGPPSDLDLEALWVPFEG